MASEAHFLEEHTAVCSECDYLAKWSRSGTFMDAFFLPRICKGCGRYMSGDWTNQDEPHWVHVERIFKRVPAVKTRNPLTWFRSDKWELHRETRSAA